MDLRIVNLPEPKLAFTKFWGLLRRCWEPLKKLLGASREVTGSLLRSCWAPLEKLLGAS
jgi:hypothetical protein